MPKTKSSLLSSSPHIINNTRSAKGGESFEGENDLVSEVFSKERVKKMHNLAKDHQHALSACDIMDLRKIGVTVNKSLVSDYSRYVSMKQQNKESSEGFPGWLNIKSSPTMFEAPSMFVLQHTKPGQGVVNRVEIREFGPTGRHYNKAALPEEGEEAPLDEEEAPDKYEEMSMEKKAVEESMAIAEETGDVEEIERHVNLIHTAASAIEDLKSREHEAAAREHEATALMDRASHKIEDLQVKLEGAWSPQDCEAHAELVDKAARALQTKTSELQRLHAEMAAIKGHLKCTSTRARAGGMHNVADQVHSLCKQLMDEREKNEALMAQCVGGGGGHDGGGEAASAPLFKEAQQALIVLNNQKRKDDAKLKELHSDNEVLSKDMQDAQAELEHYRGTVNTLMGQNMDYKRQASSEQYQKEVHRSRAVDLSHKLASTLHYHMTDDDGAGNAQVFIKAKDGGCSCEEFDSATADNVIEGALLVGSTPVMINDLEIGQKCEMEIQHCSSLTDDSGEPVSSVPVERMSNRADGTLRGRLENTLMLGQHTIQSVFSVVGEKQDYYSFLLNAH